MTVDEVLKLVNAGFTKEEIAQLNMTSTQTDDQPEDQTEDQTEDHTEAQTEEQAADPVQTQLDQLMKAMEKMSGMIINHNLNANVTDGAQTRSVDEMLAEVINPPTKGK